LHSSLVKQQTTREERKEIFAQVEGRVAPVTKLVEKPKMGMPVEPQVINLEVVK
jgi:hypothetical protein